MGILQNQVMRQVAAADAAEQRLKDEVAQSGALPGEVGIVWVYKYASGVWPRLN